MFRYLIIAACASLAYGLIVGSCSGGLPTTTSVDIIGCTVTPCILVRGDNVTGLIDFQTPISTTSLRPRVKFTVGSGSGEFPMPADQQNACNHLIGGACPLDATEDVTWRLTMSVLEEYPAETTLILEVSLIGDADQVVTCFEVPAVVV